MVDFTTPNLLGSSEQFNKLSSQFSSIKSTLKNSLEVDINTLVGQLTGSLSVLDADMKGLIPELPSIPDISLISEIQNLVALPTGSVASLASLANIESQFGDALSASGFSLDGIVGDATSSLSGTFDSVVDDIVGDATTVVDDIVGDATAVVDSIVGDVLSDFDIVNIGLPNFVIGANGIPTLKPSDVGMPDSDPVDEDGASLTTPSVELASVNASIDSDVSVAAKKLQEAVVNIQVVIASQSGGLSNKTISEFDEADVAAETSAIRAGSAATPGAAKVKDAVLTNKTLPPVSPVIILTGEAAVEIESLKVFQDEVAEFENELIGEYERLSHLLLKYKQKSPHNLTADAKRQIVFDKKTKLAPARFLGSSLGGKKDINQFYKFYQTQITRAKLKIEDINDQITKRIDFIQGGSLTSITTEINGETIIRTIKAADNKQSINERFVAYKKNDGDELIKSMDTAYEEAEKTFSILRQQ